MQQLTKRWATSGSENTHACPCYALKPLAGRAVDQLQVAAQNQIHILRDSKQFVNQIKKAVFPGGSLLAKADIKECFMSGDIDVIRSDAMALRGQGGGVAEF